MAGAIESGKTREQLLAEARELEDDAIWSAEGGPSRERREQAAALRRQALGETSYPVLGCSECLRLTGWLSTGGLCCDCVQRHQREREYTDPHGGWVAVADRRPEVEPPPLLPLSARIGAFLGLRRSLRRATSAAWQSRVEPDDTGPIEPEEGYELEIAHREQLPAPDGSGYIVGFSAFTHRFDEGGWVQLDTTRIGPLGTLTPAEFSAGLPIEQLADAWGDYCGEVTAFNRGAWVKESERREAARQAASARADLLADQAGVAELLDDGSEPRE